MKKINLFCIGSSETTREASIFYFDNVLFKTTPKSSGIQNQKPFFEWFIGFTEGDGSFGRRYFPIKDNPKNARPYFTINQKDPKVLYKIKKELGFGKIIYIAETENHNAYYRYSVSKLEHIEWLIHFFNGNLLLTKVQDRFVEWVKSFNNLYSSSKEKNFESIPLKPFFKEAVHRISLNSGWLAGFTDAEGGFYGSLSENKRFKTGFRERWKFYIVQKNERWLLFRIGELVEETALKKSGVTSKPTSWINKKHVTDSKKKANIHRLEIHRAESLRVLIDYFDRYPLLSKQQLVFIRWKRCFLYKDKYKESALKSKKGMRRYIKIFASIGAIRKIIRKENPDLYF